MGRVNLKILYGYQTHTYIYIYGIGFVDMIYEICCFFHVFLRVRGGVVELAICDLDMLRSYKNGLATPGHSNYYL